MGACLHRAAMEGDAIGRCEACGGVAPDLHQTRHMRAFWTFCQMHGASPDQLLWLGRHRTVMGALAACQDLKWLGTWARLLGVDGHRKPFWTTRWAEIHGTREAWVDALRQKGI